VHLHQKEGLDEGDLNVGVGEANPGKVRWAHPSLGGRKSSNRPQSIIKNASGGGGVGIIAKGAIRLGSARTLSLSLLNLFWKGFGGGKGKKNSRVRGLLDSLLKW